MPSAASAEEVANQRNGPAGIGQLPPHQHHQREAEHEKQKRGNRVLDADHLVIDREHVLAPERKFLVRMIVRQVMAMTVRDAAMGGHVIQLELLGGFGSSAFRWDCMQKHKRARGAGAAIRCGGSA
jgi:hypothetical protein